MVSELRATPAATEAEEEFRVLGAALERPDLLDTLRPIIAAEDFTDPDHRAIWTAMLAVADGGLPLEEMLVAAELGDVDRMGRRWPLVLFDMHQAADIPDAAPAIARRIHERAVRRHLSIALASLAERAVTADPESVLAQVQGLLVDSRVKSPTDRLIDGASFALEVPAMPPAVWGQGSEILWSRGEPLLIVGPDGTYKTTLLAHLTLGLLGLFPNVLGMPVEQVERVLYVAADRPQQIQRCFARLVDEDERGDLELRLVVHRGPLTFDVTERHALARFAQSVGAGALLTDSLGAIVPGLAKDEVGSAVRLAIDDVIADGTEFATLHHNRKATNDNKEPRKLEDVYGSRWLTAGMGSVISLWGKPGDPVVSFRHLKTPAGEVGPFRIDAGADGWLSVKHGSDLAGILARPGGISAREAAMELYEVAHPSDAEVEKARRQLEKAVAQKRAVVLNEDHPKRYGAAAPRAWLEGVG
jgi:replicative DNA helicase